MANKKNTALFLLLISLSFSAIAQQKKTTRNPTSSIDKTVLVHGQKVYETVCATCHQPDGSGVPGLNPPLIKTGWVLGDKSKLISLVLNGLQDKIEINGESYENIMPANDYLTDQEIADVLTFVRNNFGNKASSIKPSEVKAQRHL
jgi:mono/diheme cytochrome c family protein